MSKIYRKGPKWQKENSVKVKVIKRNITKETIKEVVDKTNVNVVNTNDQTIGKTILWELFCSFVLGCGISNLLYTLVNSEGYSLYRITFSESTWYACLFTIITFISIHVFISLLYLIKFIIKQDIKYIDFCLRFIDTFKYSALFGLVMFLVSIILPISTSIKLGIFVIVVIILMVSMYDTFTNIFCNNEHYLMGIFVFSVVITVFGYILLSGFIQGNFTRL